MYQYVSITMMSTNSFVKMGALSMTTLKLASGSSMERPSICLYVKPRESRMPWIRILPGENWKWKYMTYIKYLINIWTYCHSLLIRVQHEAEATYGHSKWSRATRLVTVLLLHCFDDGHAEVDIGDTVIAFFIHLLPTKIRGMWKLKAEASCSSYRAPVLPKNGWLMMTSIVWLLAEAGVATAKHQNSMRGLRKLREGLLSIEVQQNTNTWEERCSI